MLSFFRSFFAKKDSLKNSNELVINELFCQLLADFCPRRMMIHQSYAHVMQTGIHCLHRFINARAFYSEKRARFSFFYFDLSLRRKKIPERAVIINPIFKIKFPFHVIFSKSPMQVQGRLLLSIKMKPLYPVKTVTIPNVIHKPNNR